MQFYYGFAILCLIFPGNCKSIIESNDTALELLNNCKCVEKEYCHNGYVNIRGVGVIELRNDIKNDSVTNGPVDLQCSKPSKFCCRERKFGSRSNITLSLSKKEEEEEPKPQSAKNEQSQKYCGRQRPTLNVRIFGGQDDINRAVDGEFPWMASIHRKSQMDGNFQFRCAGSLISDAVVLTAAHCVYSSRKKPCELRIIANAKKELGNIGSAASEERNVKKILVHPDYYSGGAHNDIALIFLSESYNESKELNSICLPHENITYDGSKCLATGWGKGNEEYTTGEKILSKVQLPLLKREDCQELLRKTRLGPDFHLHESAICAGGHKGKDTCKGDGGGPLICPHEEDRFVQVGIVSWGVECSKENHPGVYTDVKKFSDWIQNSIRLNS